MTGKVIQSSVLPKLERVAGVKSCRFCLHPHTVCGCSQISAWSHTSTRQTPATATTTRSHDSTSVSTSTCPPPGLSSHGASASPSSCHPFLRGWERSHPRNDKEITGAGVPDHYHRLWSRALHQESGSPFPDQRGSRTGPSGSDPGKELVLSPKGI